MVLLGVLILGGGGWWYYQANDGLSRRGRNGPMDLQVKTLYAALQAGDTQAIDRMLTEQPKLARARFGSDGTLLHVASRYNHPEEVRLLVEWGADVSDSNGRFGATPLHWAAWWGSADAAAELIRNGAQVDAPSSLGPPLRWAVRGAVVHRNPRTDYRTIVQLLLDRGADVNGGDARGWSRSLEGSASRVADVLRQHGAKLDSVEADVADASTVASWPRQ